MEKRLRTGDTRVGHQSKREEDSMMPEIAKKIIDRNAILLTANRDNIGGIRDLINLEIELEAKEIRSKISFYLYDGYAALSTKKERQDRANECERNASELSGIVITDEMIIESAIRQEKNSEKININSVLSLLSEYDDDESEGNL